MGHKLPCAVLLCAALLAGCAAGQSPAPDRSAPALETVSDKPAEELFVDDPASPYPMVVESWSADLDGDGLDELVELRAEKAYFGNESESGKWLESTDYGLHPYTLLVTAGDTLYELPLGRDSNEEKCLHPYYFPLDSDYCAPFWTEDQSGRPVLLLAFDNMAQGGAGGVDVYALAFQDGEPVFLPVPEFGYHIEAALDEETMISQVTVLETGYTETLNLSWWLENYERRNREHGYDLTFEPIYNENGILEWPVAPGNIDGFYHAEVADGGVTLRQYVWGSAHADGMGALVTTMSWEDGQPVVLDQRFDWD